MYHSARLHTLQSNLPCTYKRQELPRKPLSRHSGGHPPPAPALPGLRDLLPPALSSRPPYDTDPGWAQLLSASPKRTPYPVSGVNSNTPHNCQAVKPGGANAALGGPTERQRWVTLARLPQGGWNTTNPIRVSLAWLRRSGNGCWWRLPRAVVTQDSTGLLPEQFSSKPWACTLRGGQQAQTSSEFDHAPGTYKRVQNANLHI